MIKMACVYVLFKASFTISAFNTAMGYGKWVDPQPSIKTWSQVCPGNSNEYILNVSTVNSVEGLFLANLGDRGYLSMCTILWDETNKFGGGNSVRPEYIKYRDVPSDCFVNAGTQ